jgi:hypothetical protein
VRAERAASKWIAQAAAQHRAVALACRARNREQGSDRSAGRARHKALEVPTARLSSIIRAPQSRCAIGLPGPHRRTCMLPVVFRLHEDAGWRLFALAPRPASSAYGHARNRTRVCQSVPAPTRNLRIRGGSFWYADCSPFSHAHARANTRFPQSHGSAACWLRRRRPSVSHLLAQAQMRDPCRSPCYSTNAPCTATTRWNRRAQSNVRVRPFGSRRLRKLESSSSRIEPVPAPV